VCYEFILSKFNRQFGEKTFDSVAPDDIHSFLIPLTDGKKQSTKRNRYCIIKTFFNFIISAMDLKIPNPCDTPILQKMFKIEKPGHWEVLDKETVDEIIFRTMRFRNRIMLELMARGGMRIGEVLKLRPRDIRDRKLIISSPKSGKIDEVVYIPRKVAERLKEFIIAHKIAIEDRIFPISYTAARMMVGTAGKLVNIHLRPHDLRRHAATYASRSGTPIEIVSKVILRHAHLSTTQRYLGKVSDIEAMRWIENLYG